MTTDRKKTSRIPEFIFLLSGMGIAFGEWYRSGTIYASGFAFDMMDRMNFTAISIIVVCFFIYVTGLIFQVIGLFVKTFSTRWIAAILLVPLVAYFAIYKLTENVPTFRDGMADRVCRDLSEDELLAFAEDARQLLPAVPQFLRKPIEDVALDHLMKRHPPIAAIRGYSPRVEVTMDYIEVSWGGMLSGICGLRIVDAPEIQEPIMESEKANTTCNLQNVYPRTWVYLQTF